MGLNAEALQSTIDAQALQIKQLKRALSLKEQELKVLLITIKNAKQESMLYTNQQHLEFQDVDNVSATRVVVKPSMLSETAIKEIDQSGDIDTDALEDSFNKKFDENATANNTQAGLENSNMTNSANIVDKTTLPTIKEEIDTVQKVIDKQVVPKLTRIKPSTFALKVDTQVYKKIFDTEGEDWTIGMRFTSNKKRGTWIKITGKITDSGWKQVKSDLWIDESCVNKIR